MHTIVSVQGLRAIAALSVVLCHFDIIAVWLGGRTRPFALEQLASGVDLFFVISGFIMVYSSGDLFATKLAWLKFFSRRVARIVPLYWVTTLAAIPIMALMMDWDSLLRSFLFVPYRTGAAIVPVYGVGWTLNFEMFFYTLFSAVIFLRREIAVPLLCTILTSLVVLGYFLKPTFAPFAFWSDPIILEFAFGMVIAALYVRGVRLPAVVRILLVIAGVVAIWFSFNSQNPPTGYRVLAWGIPAAMIFAGTVLGTEINFGPFTKTVKMLGDSSYSLYLLHPIASALVMNGWPLGLNQYPIEVVIFSAIIAVQLVSIAVYYLFEKKLAALPKRLFEESLETSGGVHGLGRQA